MPTFRSAIVTKILSERPGLQRVALGGELDGSRAYTLTALTGTVAVGDEVVVNTTAVDRSLGTGGWHVIHWNLGRTELVQPGPEHIMKMRYTSLQADVGTDELAHRDLPDRIDGVVVVACLVHSQVGVVAAVLKHLRPDLRVGYVMTDGGALPIALSDLVADLQSRGLLDVTVTAGHAFGGDLEAVSVPSGLALARHVGRADIIICGLGPGVVGTASSLGNTGVDAGWVLSATAAMGGTPVLCVRASSGDPRKRHQGLSHHSRAALRFAGGSVWTGCHPEEIATVENTRQRNVEVPPTSDILEQMGLRITTMGRDSSEDPLFFTVAGEAAAVAIDLVERP